MESLGAGPSFFSKVPQENSHWSLQRLEWCLCRVLHRVSLTGFLPFLYPDDAAVLPTEQPCEIQSPTSAVQEDFSAQACQEKDGVENTEDNS